MLNVVRASEIIEGRELFVEAQHERARAFYEKYGFEAGTKNPIHLFMTVATIRKNLGL